MELNKIYNEDCTIGMKLIPDGCIDCVLTDPPYLYLKGHKLDRPFDEELFFNEVRRILKPDGFIAMFGRGTAFYRWNTMLAQLGFVFKEEVVWDKCRTVSPLNNLSRRHETLSIHCKTVNGKVKRIKVPTEEVTSDRLVVENARRIISFIRNNDIEVLKNKLSTINTYDRQRKSKNYVTYSSSFPARERNLDTFLAIKMGSNERDVMCVPGVHYKTLHPTQKPVRLIERIMSLITDEGNVVLDPFMGSGTTAIAAMNLGRNFIGFEIDEEYYELSQRRVADSCPMVYQKQNNL